MEHIINAYISLFIFQMSSSFSSLASILNDNKLIGPNYLNWKRNLDIILTSIGYKYVLIGIYPQLGPNPMDDERLEFEKWNKVDEMAKYYILASLSLVL